MIPLTNPTAEAGQYITLLGFRRYFVPGGPRANASAIHLGHVRTPSRTPAITEKTVETAINGITEEVKVFTTKIAQTGTFESASAGDPTIRALHAGGPLITAPLVAGAAAFQATHRYALADVVVPVVPNGHVYHVSTAGDSGAAEPVWPTAPGSTVVSGTVTFTEAGADTTGGYAMILENHAYTYGLMIEVNLNGEDPSYPCEINVAPNVGLRGDGYGSGFDGQNETLLKFSEKILSATGYAPPVSVGSLGAHPARGVILLPSIPANKWQDVVTSLITGV